MWNCKSGSLGGEYELRLLILENELKSKSYYQQDDCMTRKLDVMLSTELMV